MLACAALAQLALAQIPLIGLGQAPPPSGHGEYGAHRRRRKSIKPIWDQQEETAGEQVELQEAAAEIEASAPAVEIERKPIEGPPEQRWPALLPPIPVVEPEPEKKIPRRYVHVPGVAEDNETTFARGHIEQFAPATNSGAIEALLHHDEEHDEHQARAWSQDHDEDKVISDLAMRFFGHEPEQPSDEEKLISKLEAAIEKLTEKPRKRRIVRDRHGRVKHIIEE